MNKKGRIIVFSLVFGIVLAMAALVRTEYENIPDATTTRYGFPLVWLFHQTTSIVGPVDIWTVEWSILVVDFIFWWVISAVIIFTWNKIRSK